MFETLAVVAVVYGAMVAVVAVGQRRLMYFPDRATPAPAAFGVADMSPVSFRTEDGLTLGAWYKPPASDGMPVLVVFHGNAGHIGHRGFKARLFLDLGFGILLASYRGYGGNPGTPSEEGLLRDGRAAVAWLAARGVGANRVVLYGESLGTGVAVRLAGEAAKETPFAAVVLEAPFTSAEDIAAAAYPIFPVRLLMRDRFNSVAWIGRVAAPVLIVHGERDTVIPVRFGRRLLAAARPPKTGVFLKNAGHNDLFEHGAARAVLDFLTKEGVYRPRAKVP